MCVLWPQIGGFCFYVLEKEMVKLSAQSPPKKEAIKVEEGLLRRSGPSGERERQSESNENLKIQHLKV